jgi:hypothetical protein
MIVILNAPIKVSPCDKGLEEIRVKFLPSRPIQKEISIAINHK